MRVKVHAVIWQDGRLVVARQRRQGKVRLSLPGGRVKLRESLLEALVREVSEETGLTVEPGPLLYAAEASSPNRIYEAIFVFRAEPTEPIDERQVHLVEPDGEFEGTVLPPVLGEIAADAPKGWRGLPRWLGNIWDPGLTD
jgi:8-oxo-dGTP pyrophosphatase MutT (NUDIX family)